MLCACCVQGDGKVEMFAGVLNAEWGWPTHTGAGLENRLLSFLQINQLQEAHLGERAPVGWLAPLRDFECCAKEFGLCICSLIFRDPSLPPAVSNLEGAIKKESKVRGAPYRWVLPLCPSTGSRSTCSLHPRAGCAVPVGGGLMSSLPHLSSDHIE